MLAGFYILLVLSLKADRLKDIGQTKKQHNLFFLFTFLFSLLTFLCFSFISPNSVLFSSVYNQFTLLIFLLNEYHYIMY